MFLKYIPQSYMTFAIHKVHLFGDKSSSKYTLRHRGNDISYSFHGILVTISTTIFFCIPSMVILIDGLCLWILNNIYSFIMPFTFKR
jgi:hypothetical protein